MSRDTRSTASDLERAFLTLCKMEGLPAPETEVRFHPDRKWRWDAAWPNHRVAVELEGGIYSGGRHTRGAGYEKDLEKHNAGVALGWKLYRFSARMVESGEATLLLKRVLHG